MVNVVFVKKVNGKWWVCIDFTDFNKAYSKDNFSLPRIDQLMDTSGHHLLTFIDAFSGCNQIKMELEDKGKMTFITNNGLFCYGVMSFGLKNVGVTYQRLVNKVFSDQIMGNLEVYIGDILSKVGRLKAT